jgi:hypothetical protein
MRKLLLWFFRIGADEAATRGWLWLYAGVKSASFGGMIAALTAFVASALNRHIDGKSAVLLFLCSAALALVVQVSSRRVASSGPANTENENDVSDDITPEYLAGFFKDHTGIQGEKLVRPYVGKWMTVRGPLGEVEPYNRYFSQVTFAGWGGPTVYMYVKDRKEVERFEVLRKGVQIAVRGQIREVNSVNVHLEKCRLVAVMPSNPDTATPRSEPSS